jgi:hypothetical protein
MNFVHSCPLEVIYKDCLMVAGLAKQGILPSSVPMTTHVGNTVTNNTYVNNVAKDFITTVHRL